MAFRERNNQGKNKRVVVILLVLTMLASLSGCGSASPAAMRDSSYEMSSEAGQAALEPAPDGYADGLGVTASENKSSGGDYGTDAGAISQPPSAPDTLGRKIIRDGSATLETVEYEKTINSLYAMMTSLGGFVESQTMQGGRYNYSALRNASITVRVPSAKFDEAMFGLSKLGTIVQQNTNGTDITDQYTDSETRARNLKVQETRILELIMKAEKLDEIVVLEQRLSDLRYQIESLENSLKNFDRMLEYSRITLQISEVVKESDIKPVPKTLGERITQAFETAWTGFVEGLQDFMVWLVMNMFTLIILGLVVLLLVQILRTRNRRREKRVKSKAENGKTIHHAPEATVKQQDDLPKE